MSGPHPPNFVQGQLKKILFIKKDLSPHDSAGRTRDEAHDGKGGYRLAASGLAYQAKGLSPVDLERDPLRRFDHASSREEVGFEFFQFQQDGALRHTIWTSFLRGGHPRHSVLLQAGIISRPCKRRIQV